MEQRTSASAVGQTDNIRAELILNDNKKIPIHLTEAQGQTAENINIVITINRDTALTAVVRPAVVEGRPSIVAISSTPVPLETEQEAKRFTNFNEKLNSFNDVRQQDLKKTSKIFNGLQEAKLSASKRASTIAFIDFMQDVVQTPEPKLDDEPATKRSIPAIEHSTGTFQITDSKESMNDAGKREMSDCRRLLIVSPNELKKIAPKNDPTIAYISTVDQIAVVVTEDQSVEAPSQKRIVAPKDENLVTNEMKDSREAFNDVTKREFSRCYKLFRGLKEAVKIPRPTVAYLADDVQEEREVEKVEGIAKVETKVERTTESETKEYTTGLEAMNDKKRPGRIQTVPLVEGLKRACKPIKHLPTVAYVAKSEVDGQIIEETSDRLEQTTTATGTGRRRRRVRGDKTIEVVTTVLIKGDGEIVDGDDGGHDGSSISATASVNVEGSGAQALTHEVLPITKFTRDDKKQCYTSRQVIVAPPAPSKPQLEPSRKRQSQPEPSQKRQRRKRSSGRIEEIGERKQESTGEQSSNQEITVTATHPSTARIPWSRPREDRTKPDGKKQQLTSKQDNVTPVALPKQQIKKRGFIEKIDEINSRDPEEPSDIADIDSAQQRTIKDAKTCSLVMNQNRTKLDDKNQDTSSSGQNFAVTTSSKPAELSSKRQKGKRREEEGHKAMEQSPIPETTAVRYAKQTTEITKKVGSFSKSQEAEPAKARTDTDNLRETTLPERKENVPEVMPRRRSISPSPLQKSIKPIENVSRATQDKRRSKNNRKSPDDLFPCGSTSNVNNAQRAAYPSTSTKKIQNISAEAGPEQSTENKTEVVVSGPAEMKFQFDLVTSTGSSPSSSTNVTVSSDDETKSPVKKPAVTDSKNGKRQEIQGSSRHESRKKKKKTTERFDE